MKSVLRAMVLTILSIGSLYLFSSCSRNEATSKKISQCLSQNEAADLSYIDERQCFGAVWFVDTELNYTVLGSKDQQSIFFDYNKPFAFSEDGVLLDEPKISQVRLQGHADTAAFRKRYLSNYDREVVVRNNRSYSLYRQSNKEVIGPQKTLYSGDFYVTDVSGRMFGICHGAPMREYLEKAPFLDSRCWWIFPYYQGTTLEIVLAGEYQEEDLLKARAALDRIIRRE